MNEKWEKSVRWCITSIFYKVSAYLYVEIDAG